MALQAKEIPRVFYINIKNNKVQLEDPNPAFSADEVREMYSNQYPELLNASVISKGIENDKLVFEFQTVAGTKG